MKDSSLTKADLLAEISRLKNQRSKLNTQLNMFKYGGTKKKPPSKAEILHYAEFKGYVTPSGKWNKQTDIFQEGFMLGWDLAFSRIPFQPESKETKRARKLITKMVQELKSSKTPITI